MLFRDQSDGEPLGESGVSQKMNRFSYNLGALASKPSQTSCEFRDIHTAIVDTQLGVAASVSSTQAYHIRRRWCRSCISELSRRCSACRWALHLASHTPSLEQCPADLLTVGQPYVRRATELQQVRDSVRCSARKRKAPTFCAYRDLFMLVIRCKDRG